MNYRKIALLLFLFSFFSQVIMAQLPSCSPASKYYSKDSINIVTFGASTIEGTPVYNFQDDLKLFIENCYAANISVNIINKGVAGETSEQGLARFEAAIEGRTGFVIIQMGINDVPLISRKQRTVEHTIANVDKMIQIALDHKLVPIVGTLQYYRERRPNQYKTYNNIIDQLNAAYKDHAAKKNLIVGDINALIGKDGTLYRDDLHPNKKGYRIISLLMFEALNKSIERSFLDFVLAQNYPNPCSTYTNIGFTVPTTAKVIIQLFNMNGQLVAEPINDVYSPGFYEERIDMSRFAAGIYLYILRTNNQIKTRKLILTR